MILCYIHLQLVDILWEQQSDGCGKFNKVVWCLQGAAFDLPQASAEAMLEHIDELTSRKFTLDRPSSLPMSEERRWAQ